LPYEQLKNNVLYLYFAKGFFFSKIKIEQSEGSQIADRSYPFV
jgi:hypothetical protein